MTPIKDVKEFFNPKSVAVVGASNNPEKVGNILMQKLKNFKGKTIPINKNEKIICRKKSYSSLKKCPHKIDLAIVAIPAKYVYKILQQCGKKNIKNIIVISAGFSETKHYKLQKDLMKAERKYKLNILGPNCFGIFNAKLKLDTTFANFTPKKGSTAFISQSGALWSYASDLNLGFSGFVSLGNMADLDFSDFIEYFNKDKSTKKIICYIEKLKEGRRFIEACKKSKKEIIVIKAGKTEQGKKATISHTASLATDFEIYSGAFKQAKVKVRTSLASALKLKKQNIKKYLKGEKTLVITNAGGAGALLIDDLTKKGFQPNKLIDILGTANANTYRKALSRIKTNYNNIVIILTPQTMSQPTKTSKILSNSIFKENIIALFLGDKSVKEAVKILKENNIPVLTRGI